MIGWAIMRQVRVQSDACRIENIVRQYFNHCDADYTFSNQEKRSFTLKWINQTTQISNSSIDQAFAYQSDKVLDSYINIGRYNTYDSGGYVYQFRGRLSSLYGNISELHQLQWINSRTRAVIIELTLYNPNSELFSAITFLTEFLPTGGVQTNARIEPVSFQSNVSILPWKPTSSSLSSSIPISSSSDLFYSLHDLYHLHDGHRNSINHSI